jgi:hypothetical protein
MPAISRLARKRWFIFKHANAGSSQDPQTSFIVGYLLGWRECVSGTAGFAGLPEQLHRLSELLEDTAQWQAAAEAAVTEEELDADELAEIQRLTAVVSQ